LFEDLISIQGVGPKTAISVLNGGVQNTINLIAGNDEKVFQKFLIFLKKMLNKLFLNFTENTKNSLRMTK
ncbi:helix-hairpin-helix domain-containing protein, partial [Mesomycoplasma ovipneumoniae]|uniref:helix-hairpin-helix domain-containing protein n=1 Tax=Mesomycoplasma ovipneumoniae TaxID=29562 RepID=UPI002079E40A